MGLLEAQQISLFPESSPELGSESGTTVERRRAQASQPLRVAVLGSGSSGNCVLLESGSRRLLVDAGFSCREIEKRLRAVGVSAETVGALVLTHEHRDHCRGAERFARRHSTPVYATAGTLEGGALGRAGAAATRIASGRPFEAAGLWIEPFAVPHDAREPVGMVIEDSAGRRVGVVGDLGARSQLAWAHLHSLSVLLLETNHDLEMLRSGPYPWRLKQRVASRHGHLSNREAAEGVVELACDQLQWVVLYHLSRTNNLPALAEASVGEVLERVGSRARLAVSEQSRVSDWLDIDEFLDGRVEEEAMKEQNL